jgi:uncharacterized protein YjbI with pentapeptide repeats
MAIWTDKRAWELDEEPPSTMRQRCVKRQAVVLLESGPPRHAWIFVAVGMVLAALLYYFVEGSYLWAGLLLVVSVMFGLVVILPRSRFLAPDRPASTLDAIADDDLRLKLQDDRLKLQNDVRTSLLQAATGIALLVGVFFTWKQLQYDRREALQIKDQSREQIELARQGQVADRFTQAVGQLGSKQITVRLGGIYSLETIANQSHDTRLVVFEVLTAYVRQHASIGAEDDRRLEVRLPDVQAAMTVLGRRTALPSDPPLNLRNVDLHGANLKHARLSGALFDEANLNGADFQYAQLENTHFAEAKLRGARFDYAQARRLDVHHADLREAGFKHVEALNSNFEDSNLQEARFDYAILNDADIKCADLKKSHFDNAQLQGAQFHRSDLNGAELDSAELQDATATTDTNWPPSFDWRTAGVKMVEPKNLHCGPPN